MGKPRIGKEPAEVVKIAEGMGWQYVGFTGQGHLLMVHENGSKVTISATPSGHIWRKQAISQLKRLGADTE